MAKMEVKMRIDEIIINDEMLEYLGLIMDNDVLERLLYLYTNPNDVLEAYLDYDPEFGALDALELIPKCLLFLGVDENYCDDCEECECLEDEEHEEERACNEDDCCGDYIDGCDGCNVVCNLFNECDCCCYYCE